MSEEPEVAVVDDKSEAPVSMIDENGKFTEKWKEGLDEDIRGEVCLDTCVDVKSMAKQYVHAQRKFGKNSIVKPDENASEADWDEFNIARGRPETVGDYKYAKLDSIDYDDVMIGKFLEGCHKRGFNQEDIDFLSEFDNNRVLQTKQVNVDNIKAAKNEAEDVMREELGIAYDERIHLATRVMSDDKFVPEDDREEFIKEFGNNPNFIRFAIRVGSRLAEHKEIVAKLTEPSVGEAQAQIDELQATPGYADTNSKVMNSAQRDSITKQIEVLYKKLYPEKG